MSKTDMNVISVKFIRIRMCHRFREQAQKVVNLEKLTCEGDMENELGRQTGLSGVD